MYNVDPRVKFINSRWGAFITMQLMFELAIGVSALLYFVTPEMMTPLSTIFGIKMSIYFIVWMFFTLFGFLLAINTYFITPRYSEYLVIDGIDFPVPYFTNNMKPIIYLPDNKKEVITWVNNSIWYDKLIINKDKTKDNESKSIDFIVLDSTISGIRYVIKNINTILNYVESIDGNLQLEGYFTYTKHITRNATIFGIKYLGKELQNDDGTIKNNP